MTFWIYNYGLAVPLPESSLKIENGIRKLTKLSKTSRLSGSSGGVLASQAEPLEIEGSGRSSERIIRYETNSKPRQAIAYSNQIMSSPVVSLLYTLSISEAYSLFTEKRYRHFPVLNEQKQLVGILSDRDLMYAVLAEQLNSKPTLKDKSISEIMIKDVLTASEDTDIKEICRVMFRQHVGAILITNELGAILGIITRSDILRSMIRTEPLELWI